MGVVYRAWDEKLRRPRAQGPRPRRSMADDERPRAFLREARTAAAVAHANVAAIFEVGEEAGRVFIAMELVEGETLRSKMAARPVAPKEAVRIARGIARGLSRAHAKGIVHRDLKPENVMLDPEGEPKILDFGLAKIEAGARAAASADDRRRSARDAKGACSGRRGTCRPSRRRATRWTCARTSSRSG